MRYTGPLACGKLANGLQIRPRSAWTALADLSLYSRNILKNILCLFLQDFVNLNVTQLLIG